MIRFLKGPIFRCASSVLCSATVDQSAGTRGKSAGAAVPATRARTRPSRGCRATPNQHLLDLPLRTILCCQSCTHTAQQPICTAAADALCELNSLTGDVTDSIWPAHYIPPGSRTALLVERSPRVAVIVNSDVALVAEAFFCEPRPFFIRVEN
jgi:hypothetical protein